MPCTSPITGYRTAKGTVTFDRSVGYSDRPVNVPCQQCIDCRIDRAAQWTTRILHEAQMTAETGRGSSFITLTYDKHHLPVDAGLDVRHWQLFAKRLRKTLGPFRFFHVGEYGEKNLRPHYHAIVFGHDFPDRQEAGENDLGQQHYLSPTLTQLWGMGNAITADCERMSAAYVARYALKKRTGTQSDDFYTRCAGDLKWIVPKEYATMSLKPGIGAGWLSKYYSDVYPSDRVIVDGKRVKTPRAYDRVLEERDKNLYTKIQEQRREQARTKRTDNTPARLSEKAEHTRLRVNQRARRL